MFRQSLADHLGRRCAVGLGQHFADGVLDVGWLQSRGNADTLTAGGSLGRHDDRVDPQFLADHVHGLGHAGGGVGFEPHRLARLIA